MAHPADDETVTGLLILAFLVAIGPLAVLYGADSRVDDRRR
jgi:hypothetical protein